MNITAYIGMAGLVASLSLAYLWQSEKTENAKLQGELTAIKQHVSTLKDSLKEQTDQAVKSMELVAKNADSVSSYEKSINAARVKIDLLQNNINSLRAKELEDAMQDPFNRGNHATERWNHVMQLISGQDRDAKDSNNPDPAKSGDTGTTSTTVN